MYDWEVGVGLRLCVILLLPLLGRTLDAHAQRSGEPDRFTRLDSTLLERTHCFGPCPAYRVLLTFGGLIRFWSEDASGAPTASDSVAPRLFMNVENDSMVAAVLALPDNIHGSSMCGRSVTDAPYARLTLFTNHGTKRIVDYQGCLGAPPVLRRFELLVDSVTRVDRWTHKP